MKNISNQDQEEKDLFRSQAGQEGGRKQIQAAASGDVCQHSVALASAAVRRLLTQPPDSCQVSSIHQRCAKPVTIHYGSFAVFFFPKGLGSKPRREDVHGAEPKSTVCSVMRTWVGNGLHQHSFSERQYSYYCLSLGSVTKTKTRDGVIYNEQYSGTWFWRLGSQRAWHRRLIG